MFCQTRTRININIQKDPLFYYTDRTRADYDDRVAGCESYEHEQSRDIMPGLARGLAQGEGDIKPERYIFLR